MGGINFIGGNGNTIELKKKIVYTGITGVAPGTTLKVYLQDAVSQILANGLVVTGVPTEGDLILTYTGEDTLEGLSLDKVTCPCALETTFALDESKASIVIESVGEITPAFWTGAANDGDLSNAANWSDNVVPGPGTNATISCPFPKTLTKGNTFSPSSITFAEGSAAVTIEGDDITGIVAITNLSFASHTINAKVYFTGDIQVKQAATAELEDLSKAHVTFSGGAYAGSGCSLESGASNADYSRCIFGKYYLDSTSENRWTAKYYQKSGSVSKLRVCVADGSYLYVPYAGNLTELYIGKGAKVDVGDMVMSDVDGRLVYQVYGEMVVSNMTMSGRGRMYVTYSQNTPGVFKFNSVTNALTPNASDTGYYFYLADKNKASKHTFFIGAGGLNFNGNAKAMYVIGNGKQGNYETIRPWNSDFTIANRSETDNTYSLILCLGVEFCTDDESGVGRAITIDAVTRGSSASPAKITVSGKGMLKVNRAADKAAQPSVTLKDTVTLEYTTATATLGTGTMTLGAGTTFAFVNSGSTLTLPAVTSYVLPTEGVATLRINGKRLSGGEHTILASATEGSAEHLTVDPESPALAGRKFEVVEKDGDLILNITPTGTAIVVR